MRILTVFVVVTLGAGLASAQSLGEVARRERDRRSAAGQRTPILTNEDLQRACILCQVEVPARSAEAQVALPAATLPAAPAVALPAATLPAPAVPPRAATPAAASTVPLWKVAEQPGFSLGEYARRLRQRAGRDSEPVLAEQRSAPVQAQPDHLSSPLPASPDTVAQPVAATESVIGAQPIALRRRVIVTQPIAARQPETFPPNEAADPAADPIRVRLGDSLWKLSRVYLGQGRLWSSLWKVNPEVRNPSLIYPGQLLRWPGAPALARHAEPAGSETTPAAAIRGNGGANAPDAAVHGMGGTNARAAAWAGSQERPYFAGNPAGDVDAATAGSTELPAQEASFEHSDSRHRQRNRAPARG